MWAHNGSIQMHSPSESNNQHTSQTSGNVTNNRSPQTGCCCKPVEVPTSVAPTEPSYHVPACQSCRTASGESIPPVHCTECGRLWLWLWHFWMPKAAQSSSTRADVKFAPLSLSSFAGTPKIAIKHS